MAADRRRHVLLVGVDVRDAPEYARYRAAMAPILAEHDGAFGVDLAVSAVLAGPPGARATRAFTLAFPDRDARERFFADPRYLAIRRAHFDPAVAQSTIFGVYEEVD